MSDNIDKPMDDNIDASMKNMDDLPANMDENSPVNIGGPASNEETPSDEEEGGGLKVKPPKKYTPPTETEEELRKYTLDKCFSKREFDDSYLLDDEEEAIVKCEFPEKPADYTMAGGGHFAAALDDDDHDHDHIQEQPQDESVTFTLEDDSDLGQESSSRRGNISPDVIDKLDRPLDSMMKCRPKDMSQVIQEDESFYAPESSDEDDDDDADEEAKKEKDCGSKPCPTFKPPKIPVKENNVSRFRHMHSRRPKGSRVFFRTETDEFSMKPPYVPAGNPPCV